jgi:uncharacterized protein (DUF488 family)
MSARNPVYTIGYGNRSAVEFLALLKRYDIHVVCDVRSSPYSSRFPDFSREPLQVLLQQSATKYLFMGDLLGARPSDPDCYEDGRASYSAMAKSSAFRQGIERLEMGAEKFRIVVMCAERDPLDCHRAILISKPLVDDGVDVLHVDGHGQSEPHRQLEARLLKRFKLDQTSLFGAQSEEEALAQAYKRRGHDLAYDALAAPGVSGK